MLARVKHPKGSPFDSLSIEDSAVRIKIGEIERLTDARSLDGEQRKIQTKIGETGDVAFHFNNGKD